MYCKQKGVDTCCNVALPVLEVATDWDKIKSKANRFV